MRPTPPTSSPPSILASPLRSSRQLIPTQTESSASRHIRTGLTTDTLETLLTTRPHHTHSGTPPRRRTPPSELRQAWKRGLGDALSSLDAPRVTASMLFRLLDLRRGRLRA